jgi:hypothetical protein
MSETKTVTIHRVTDAELAAMRAGERAQLPDPWSPMDRAEAVTITNQIRTQNGRVWSMLSTAHARRAWEAMGYTSWDAYVQAEFGMSRGRSYQLLDQAKVIREIENAIKEQRGEVSTSVDISEAAVRDIKAELPAVVNDVKEELAAEPQATPQDAVGRIIKTRRTAYLTRRYNSKRRTDVVGVVTRVLVKAQDAAEAAENIKWTHLANRSDESAAWGRTLRESVKELNEFLALLDRAAGQAN